MTESTADRLGLTRDQLRPEDHGTAFDARIARVLAGNGGEVTCPRCKKPARGWPLERGDWCSVKYAVYCMRDPEIVLADIARRAERRAT